MKTLNKLMAAALLASTIAGGAAVAGAMAPGGQYPAGWGSQPEGYEMIGPNSKSAVGNAVVVPRWVSEKGEQFLTVIAEPYKDALIQHRNIVLNTNYGQYVNASFRSNNASARTPAVPPTYDEATGEMLDPGSPSIPGAFYLVDAVSGEKLVYTAEIESYRDGKKWAMTPNDVLTIGGAASRLTNGEKTHSFNFVVGWDKNIEGATAGLYADIITATFDAIPLLPT